MDEIEMFSPEEMQIQDKTILSDFDKFIENLEK